MLDGLNNLVAWLELVAALVGCGAGVLSFVIRNSLVSVSVLSDKLAPLYERINAADNRVTALQTEMQHLPTQREMGALSERVGAVSTDVARIGEAIAGMNALLARIERPLNLLIDEKMKEKP